MSIRPLDECDKILAHRLVISPVRIVLHRVCSMKTWEDMTHRPNSRPQLAVPAGVNVTASLGTDVALGPPVEGQQQCSLLL
jgi:hypothetical protein